MADISRRGFLKFLGAASASVIIAPAVGKIWVPEEQAILMPEAVSAARVGALICGWMVNKELLDIEERALHRIMLAEAIHYPTDAPLMILQAPENLHSRLYRRSYSNRFSRFVYRGAGEPTLNGAKLRVVASWANIHAMAI